MTIAGTTCYDWIDVDVAKVLPASQFDLHAMYGVSIDFSDGPLDLWW